MTPLLTYPALFVGLASIFALVILAAIVCEFLERRERRQPRTRGTFVSAAPFKDSRDSIIRFREMFREDSKR